MEYGIQLETRVVVGPDWRCEAEVMDSFHGFGTTRVYGQLVVREDKETPWHPPARK